MADIDIEKRLRQEARELLEQGKVDRIIGYEAGSLKFSTTPMVTADKDDTDRLVVNPFVVNNLSAFLTGMEGKTGVVAKGCDSRSIVSLMQDRKVARENLVILGIPCPGLIDVRKIEALLGKESDELEDIAREGDKVTVTAGGKKTELPVAKVLFDNCLACDMPTPEEYDVLLGEPQAPATDPTASRAGIEELEAKSPEQRWEFWKGEFSRCTRCYACRNACPACFCQRCFVEETDPQWVLPVPRWQDNLIFQLIRTIHVAGRCTDCGNCERACPAHIPLRSLSRKMYDMVDELFHYRAGTDRNPEPLLTAYDASESED
jgi:formate dehydrogenase subunit beta